MPINQINVSDELDCNINDTTVGHQTNFFMYKRSVATRWLQTISVIRFYMSKRRLSYFLLFFYLSHL